MPLLKEDGNLLRSPAPPTQQEEAHPAVERTPSSYSPLHTFELAKGEQKHYQQQYADMYFVRLAQLKPVVEQIAQEAWADFELAGEKARQVDRVLDVRQGELCWVVGTIYMEMPLKPVVLDDIAKEHWISAPPPREKYRSSNGGDELMIEDESGRLRMTGSLLQSQMLVTGIVIAALGSENADGVFEVIDTKVADLPRQPDRWEREEASLAVAGKKVKATRPKAGKIAFVSGLGIRGDADEPLILNLLSEFLLGEAGTASLSAPISRLIIAGNSLDHASPIPTREELAARKGGKKYGYDASAYNAAPSEHLDAFLAALLPSLPVTLLPGASDPANVAMPQQPLHPALFPMSRPYAPVPSAEERDPSPWFDTVTNPWEGDVDGWRILGTSGQPVDDAFKYVEGDDSLEMMEHLLRWRTNAPTAPDTLWSYPFQDADPFLIRECPHVYFVGNQAGGFATELIEGPAGQLVRLLSLPRFRDTGELVLLDAETLAVERVRLQV